MTTDLLQKFDDYRIKMPLTRVRMSAVPAELQPLVKEYLAALSRQLSDPENESWDSLGPNEHHNARQAVYHAFAPKIEKPAGNCPRCGGTGRVLAYSHIRNGQCLKCGGTGHVKS